MPSKAIKDLVKEDHLINHMTQEEIANRYNLSRICVQRILSPESDARWAMNKKIAMMKRKGVNSLEISRRLNISYYRVRKYLGEHVPYKLSPLQRSKINAFRRDRYKHDKSFRQKCKETSRRSTAKRYLMDNGYTEQQALFALDRAKG